MDNYNGYSNKCTWIIAFWYDNELWQYENKKQLLQAYHSDAYNLSQAIKDDVFDILESENYHQATMLGDLLSTAIHSVDFSDIAEKWIEDYQAEL